MPSDEELLAISRDNVQLLFNSVFKLPRSVVEDATCAELPDQIYGLPREKPVSRGVSLLLLEDRVGRGLFVAFFLAGNLLIGQPLLFIQPNIH